MADSARAKAPLPPVQYGVLPVRLGSHRELQILLITSRRSRRWIIPKGWPIPGKSPAQTAAREALEEAGLIGTVGERPIGAFRHWKRGKGDFAMECHVHVFLMRVRAQFRWWPEFGQRDLAWLSPSRATALVHNPELGMLIARLDGEL